MSYRSKGFWHLGDRPMFDDVDDEFLGFVIKAKVFEVFGHYPILDVSETYTMCDDFDAEPVVLRDYHAMLDTEKLDIVDGFSLSYVQFLLEKIIKHKMTKPESRDMSTESSKKYCFSDTEDWWEAMQVADDVLPEGRERFEVVVELG